MLRDGTRSPGAWESCRVTAAEACAEPGSGDRTVACAPPAVSRASAVIRSAVAFILPMLPGRRIPAAPSSRDHRILTRRRGWYQWRRLLQVLRIPPHVHLVGGGFHG